MAEPAFDFEIPYVAGNDAFALMFNGTGGLKYVFKVWSVQHKCQVELSTANGENGKKGRYLL